MKTFGKLLAIFIVIHMISLGLFFEKALAEYPEKTITFIVPFNAGGGGDRTARIISSASIDHIGQALHVVNMPGASGIAGWKELINRPSDGYTIIQGTSTPVIALVMEKNPIISPSQIKMVCYVSGFRGVIASKPGTPYSASWEAFKDYAKKNPGKINVGGTTSNLMGAANLFDQAGIEVNLIPYPGTANATADFVGGHVDCLAASVSQIEPLIPKRAVPIVNPSNVPIPEKVKAFKGIPDANTLGYDGMFFPRWIGVHPDTSDEIVQYLSDKMGKLLKDKSITRLFSKLGEEITFIPHKQAEAEYKKLIQKMKKTSSLLK